MGGRRVPSLDYKPGSGETASVRTRRGAQVAVRGLEAGPLSPRRVTGCVYRQHKKKKGEGALEGWVVTKPIIFTYGLIPASRHVILNGFSDPCAGFEPWENMAPQMRLSQRALGRGPFARIHP